jgi:hypothetical protein
MRTPEEVRVRLDGVEVKVNVDAAQTRAAVQVLGLQDQPAWKIFFIEDVTPGLVSSTPLLDQHLIIRARQKAKGADDVTVKFRPGRACGPPRARPRPARSCSCSWPPRPPPEPVSVEQRASW